MEELKLIEEGRKEGFYELNIEPNTWDSLLIKLQDLGIGVICVYFCGSGDSGAIEEINLIYDENCSYIESENTGEQVKIYKTKWSHDIKPNTILVGNALDSFIGDYCYGNILEHLEDWYNNDGGSGHIHIDTKTGKYYVELEQYYTDSNWFYHDGSIMND